MKASLAREYERQIKERGAREAEQRRREMAVDSLCLEKARQELDLERLLRASRRREESQDYPRQMRLRAQASQSGVQPRYQDHQFCKESVAFDQRREALQQEMAEQLRRQIQEKEASALQRARLYPLVAMASADQQQGLRLQLEREKAEKRLSQRKYQQVLGRQVD